MSMKIYYPSVFQREEKGFSVWVPDIQGCVSQGDTFEEAVECITEAIGACLETLADNHLDIPKPSSPEKIETSERQFVSMVAFDPVAYDAKYSTKATKKTLTIPTWLNSVSEKNNVNFSAVLQAALIEKLGLSS